MSIPFINKCFISKVKVYNMLDSNTSKYCINKYYESLTRLTYYRVCDIKEVCQIFINIDTPGIVKLIVFEYPRYTTVRNKYMVISDISLIDNRCRNVYRFNMGTLHQTVLQYSYHRGKLEDICKYKPDEYKDFTTDINSLPDDLYKFNYPPHLIRIYNKSIKVHKRLVTFHLCLYRKMTDKNTRLHILSFIYG